MIDRKSAQKLGNAIWIGRSPFERSKTSGSSANISFFHNGTMYISRSGSCFGTLKMDEFAVMDMDGASLNGSKPSREWPLHLKVYQKKPGTGAIIHTHGTYGVLWSFIPVEDEADVAPDHTPYLKMKLGKVGLVSYERPGSQALFDTLEQHVMDSDGYLPKQHGTAMPEKSLMDAFFCLGELEENAGIAWMLRQAGVKQRRILTTPRLFL